MVAARTIYVSERTVYCARTLGVVNECQGALSIVLLVVALLVENSGFSHLSAPKITQPGSAFPQLSVVLSQESALYCGVAVDSRPSRSRALSFLRFITPWG